MVDGPICDVATLDSMAQTLETPCGDGRMIWRTWGRGPPVVLLHGGAGSWQHWVKTIPALHQRYRIIAPDLPGMGGSDLPPPQADLWSLARLLIEGGDRVARGERFHLVGFSFGAVLAGHMAALAPDTIRSLTFIGAGSMGLPRPRTPLTRVRGLTGDAEMAAHRENLERLMFHDPERIDADALAIQVSNSRSVRLRYREITPAAALRTVSAKLNRPLNVIYGDRDAAVFPHLHECLAHFAGLHPKVRTTVIANAGHWVAYEAADQVNLLLRDWLVEDQGL